jgi:hypothetical protein
MFTFLQIDSYMLKNYIFFDKCQIFAGNYKVMYNILFVYKKMKQVCTNVYQCEGGGDY